MCELTDYTFLREHIFSLMSVEDFHSKFRGLFALGTIGKEEKQQHFCHCSSPFFQPSPSRSSELSFAKFLWKIHLHSFFKPTDNDFTYSSHKRSCRGAHIAPRSFFCPKNHSVCGTDRQGCAEYPPACLTD